MKNIRGILPPADELDILRGQLEKIIKIMNYSIMQLAFEIGITYNTLKKFLLSNEHISINTVNKIEKFVYKD